MIMVKRTIICFGFFFGFWRAGEDPLETILGELRVEWLLGILTEREEFHYGGL
jgi:hypothetical protein